MKKYFAYILFLFLPLGFPMQTLGQTLSCIYESQEVMSCADSCTIANCAPYASERHYKLEERTPQKNPLINYISVHYNKKSTQQTHALAFISQMIHTIAFTA